MALGTRMVSGLGHRIDIGPGERLVTRPRAYVSGQ